MPDAHAPHERLPRRDLLCGLAGGALTALAGCAGGDLSDGQRDDPSLGAGQATPDDLGTFVAPMWTSTIREIQFNQFNRNNRVRPAEDVLFERGLQYDAIARTFEPRLVSSWALADETTVVVELAEGMRWHDDSGREVTAADLVAQERLTELIEVERTYDLDTVSADNDRTVRYDFAEPVNPAVVAHYYLAKQIWVQRERYESFLDELEETAGDEDARQELRRSLVEFDQPEPVGNSVWAIEDVAHNRVAFAAVEDHPDRESLEFTEYWLVANRNLDRDLLSIGENQQDAAIFPHGTALEEFEGFVIPDNITQHDRAVFSGRAIAFHHEHEPFDDPRVRRAVAAIVDVEALAASRELYGHVPATAPWGIAGHSEDVPQDVVGELADRFPAAGPDPTRAVDLLESAGFERADGEWYTATGDRFEMHLVWNSDEQIRALLEAQLREFGIAVNSERRVDGTEGPVSVERYTEALEDGLFDVIEIAWGTRVPIEGFRQVWGPDSYLRDYDFGWSTEIDMLPTPFDGEDEMAIDVSEWLQEAYADGDESQFDEHLRRLAWAFAHDLPFLPLFEHSVSVLLNPETVSLDTWDPAASLLEQVREGRIVPAS